MGAAIDEDDEGLAPERTVLAWDRTGIAFFVLIAALGRRVWPIDAGNHAWVVAGLGAAVLTILIGLFVATRLGTTSRYEGETMSRHAFLLVTVSTLLLALAGFALALSPT
jgi:uncharacterized membrane protein YidH (DUF202 family)